MEICGLIFPDKFFKKHYVKRKNEGFIDAEEEYIFIIKRTIEEADRFYVIRQFSDCKDKLVFYDSKSKWLVIILFEERQILSCYKLYVAENMEEYFQSLGYDINLREDCERESYSEVRIDENNKYSGFIKVLQDRCRTY